MAVRVFISAGEASGDTYGASLSQAIRSLRPDVTFEGLGGVRMREAGIRLHADASQWGAISIVQSVKVGLRALGAYYRVKRQLRSGSPGLFIPIDFGYVNIRLARHAKAAGWKVMYFVPPGSWRKDRQGKDIPLISDVIVTPFEWSAKILNEMGGNARWFGHPIKQIVARSGKGAAQREGIAILPGSRAHELETNLPLIAAALYGIDTRAEFALAPTVDPVQLEADWKRVAPSREDVFTQGDTLGVLRRAHTAIVCSGTATLEAALARTPMVVVYQLSESMRREAKLLRVKRPKYIALPNILLERFAVPEFAEKDGVNPADVAVCLKQILLDGQARSDQLAAFDELDALLGGDQAITEAAKLACEMIA